MIPYLVAMLLIFAIIIFSIGATNALVPLLVILILIGAAAGLTRGFDLFTLFGLSTILGGGPGSIGGKATLSRSSFPFRVVVDPRIKSSFTRKSKEAGQKQNAARRKQIAELKREIETSYNRGRGTISSAATIAQQSKAQAAATRAGNIAKEAGKKGWAVADKWLLPTALGKAYNAGKVWGHAVKPITSREAGEPSGRLRIEDEREDLRKYFREYADAKKTSPNQRTIPQQELLNNKNLYDYNVERMRLVTGEYAKIKDLESKAGRMSYTAYKRAFTNIHIRVYEVPWLKIPGMTPDLRKYSKPVAPIKLASAAGRGVIASAAATPSAMPRFLQNLRKQLTGYNVEVPVSPQAKSALEKIGERTRAKGAYRTVVREGVKSGAYTYEPTRNAMRPREKEESIWERAGHTYRIGNRKLDWYNEKLAEIRARDIERGRRAVQPLGSTLTKTEQEEYERQEKEAEKNRFKKQKKKEGEEAEEEE